MSSFFQPLPLLLCITMVASGEPHPVAVPRDPYNPTPPSQQAKPTRGHSKKSKMSAIVVPLDEPVIASLSSLPALTSGFSDLAHLGDREGTQAGGSFASVGTFQLEPAREPRPSLYRVTRKEPQARSMDGDFQFPLHESGETKPTELTRNTRSGEMPAGTVSFPSNAVVADALEGTGPARANTNWSRTQDASPIQNLVQSLTRGVTGPFASLARSIGLEGCLPLNSESPRLNQFTGYNRLSAWGMEARNLFLPRGAGSGDLRFAAAKEPVPMVAAPLPADNPSISALPEIPSEGYWIGNAPINEIFQYLARSANLQYFFNNELTGPEYNVTGHLMLADPKARMEDLAVAHGLSVYQQGTTIYLMTDAQLARLPVEVMCYQLKYLRGANPPSSMGGGSQGAEGGGPSGAGIAEFEKLKAIVKPMLTPNSGQIEFEEKNNVLLVTDNTVKLQKVRQLLEQLDRPKQQVMINVRILRVRKARGSKTGVDWSHILGEEGLPIRASQSLNALFNLPDASQLSKTLDTAKNVASTISRATTDGVTTLSKTYDADSSRNEASASARDYTDGAGLVFSSLQMEAIVHALHEKDLVSQEACPTIITEDNEQGIISIVDRFPVITSNFTATTAGQNITDEVRYKIDEDDPNASDRPEKSREIGVTLSVTPTLLPDGTVRMRLRPRVANIVEFVPGQSGNSFPRVSESTIEGISRIPNGKSLFLGGFYDSNENYSNKKVPVLGSLPLVSKLFSYKNKGNEQISLVFIITPQVYDASSTMELPAINRGVQWNSGFNRTNAEGPVTPLLPDPGWENGYLPVPADRDSQGVTPPALKKRSWFGRLFSKDPRDATPPVGGAPGMAAPVLPPEGVPKARPTPVQEGTAKTTTAPSGSNTSRRR